MDLLSVLEEEQKKGKVTENDVKNVKTFIEAFSEGKEKKLELTPEMVDSLKKTLEVAKEQEV